jgi:single-stranded-DNA-specific exonuclease
VGAGKLLVDAVVSLADIHEPLVEELERLQPFGIGNPEPLFAVSGVSARAVQRMGDNRQHLRATLVAESGARLAAVGFSMGELARFVEEPWHVVFTPEFNVWQGRRSLQARLHSVFLANGSSLSARSMSVSKSLG